MFYSQIYVSDNSDRIYLLVHGFLGSSSDIFCSQLIDYFREKKINYSAFDFLGHGLSDGDFSNLHQMVDQLHRVFNNLIHNYPNKQIIPVGFSQGGAIVLKFLSKQNNIKNSILFAPLSIPEMLINDRLNPPEIELLKSGHGLTKDFGKERIKELNKEWIDSYYSFLSEKQLSQITTKIKIFVAENDKIIHPVQNQFLRVNISNCEYIIVPKAEHTFDKVENWEFIKNNI